MLWDIREMPGEKHFQNVWLPCGNEDVELNLKGDQACSGFFWTNVALQQFSAGSISQIVFVYLVLSLYRQHGWRCVILTSWTRLWSALSSELLLRRKTQLNLRGFSLFLKFHMSTIRTEKFRRLAFSGKLSDRPCHRVDVLLFACEKKMSCWSWWQKCEKAKIIQIFAPSY